MSYRFENGWALDFSNSFLALITCKETANFAPSLSRLILDCFPRGHQLGKEGNVMPLPKVDFPVN